MSESLRPSGDADYDKAERVRRALVQAIVDDTDKGQHRWLHDPEYHAQVTIVANIVVRHLSVILDAALASLSGETPHA